jgi:hypothetical protein
MGGAVRVTSELGRGTTFHVILGEPADTAETAVAARLDA